MSGTKYPKIEPPFMRHNDEGPLRNKLDPTRWFRPEFELLADLPWFWSEKIDGTNVRIVWDGHKVTLGGRTDDAQMPTSLVTVLREMFPEEMLEQHFGATPAVLYGEGYGVKLGKGGGNYRPDQSFILFDVKIGDWWLMPGSVAEVANSLGIDMVPQIGVATVHSAIEQVTAGMSSRLGAGDFPAEGLVGRPPQGLRARNGDRLLMKVKTVDF